MKQKYTSRETSINSTKLPKVYSILPKLIHNFGGEYGTMVDYGCGKYTDHLRKEMESICMEWHGFDAFNQTETVNDDGLKAMPNADWIVCSNVLNVIAEDDVVQSIVNTIVSTGNKCAFTIYDGDRSGVGKPTKEDCYQRNQKIRDYLRFFPEGTIVKYGCILTNI